MATSPSAAAAQPSTATHETEIVVMGAAWPAWSL